MGWNGIRIGIIWRSRNKWIMFEKNRQITQESIRISLRTKFHLWEKFIQIE